jgi:hypothetical protein
MNFINILAILFYGLALFFVIYILFGMFYKTQKNTTIIYETPVYEEPPVVTEVVYPWYSGYNWWPSWGYGDMVDMVDTVHGVTERVPILVPGTMVLVEEFEQV